MLRRLTYSVVAALGLGAAVLASPDKDLTPVQVLETRRQASPRSLEREAWRNLQRDLVAASLTRRGSSEDVFKTNGSLELSWSNAELFS